MWFTPMNPMIPNCGGRSEYNIHVFVVLIESYSHGGEQEASEATFEQLQR